MSAARSGQSIDLVNAMSEQPALIIHTGDITHLSRPAEFDTAQQLFSRLRTTEMHTVPGEHDTSDAGVSEYFSRFGKASENRGYYSFDHGGVHFVGLINVLQFKPGGLGTLGEDQLAWVAADLKGALGQHAGGGLRAHAAVDDLRALGLGHRGCRGAHGAAQALRLGDRAQRPHPPDRAEGRGQHHLPHGPLHRLSAARRPASAQVPAH